MPSLRHLLSDALEIPKDLVMNLSRITLVGNLQVVIENHRGVLEYTEQEVKIALSKGTLAIRGASITLRSIGLEEIVVDGALEALCFEEEDPGHA